MKRLTALLLSALLLVSLTACGQRGIVGTWKGQVNLTGVMQEAWEKSTKNFPELQEEMDIDEVPVYLTMEFREDNTCTIDVDDESLEKFFTQTRDQMKAVVGAHMDKVIDSDGNLGSALDGVLEGDLSGLSGLLEFPLETTRKLLMMGIDNLFGPLMQEAILSGIEREGNYMEKDGKLYISKNLDTPAEEDRPNPYKLEKNTLTIESWVIYSNEKYGDFTFPLILERQ